MTTLINTEIKKYPLYEVTWLEKGETKTLTIKECNKCFGKDEFKEIVKGYHPCIVAIEV